MTVEREKLRVGALLRMPDRSLHRITAIDPQTNRLETKPLAGWVLWVRRLLGKRDRTVPGFGTRASDLGLRFIDGSEGVKAAHRHEDRRLGLPDHLYGLPAYDDDESPRTYRDTYMGMPRDYGCLAPGTVVEETGPVTAEHWDALLARHDAKTLSGCAEWTYRPAWAWFRVAPGLFLKDLFHRYVWCAHPVRGLFEYQPQMGDHPDETKWCTQCHRPVQPR